MRVRDAQGAAVEWGMLRRVPTKLTFRPGDHKVTIRPGDHNDEVESVGRVEEK